MAFTLVLPRDEGMSGRVMLFYILRQRDILRAFYALRYLDAYRHTRYTYYALLLPRASALRRCSML